MEGTEMGTNLACSGKSRPVKLEWSERREESDPVYIQSFSLLCTDSPVLPTIAPHRARHTIYLCTNGGMSGLCSFPRGETEAQRSGSACPRAHSKPTG